MNCIGCHGSPDSLVHRITEWVSSSPEIIIPLLFLLVLLVPAYICLAVSSHQKDGQIKNHDELITIINGSNRGIYKRIDENRELLELLYRDATWFMINHKWVAGWIKAQDEYLNEIAEATKQLNKTELPVGFPRAFPQVNREELLEKITQSYDLSVLGYTQALHPRVRFHFIGALRELAKETGDENLFEFCSDQLRNIENDMQPE